MTSTKAVKTVTPSVSVVVATRNRAEMLERLLDALAAQRGAGLFEVVAVDDGSTDDTWDRLTRRAEVETAFTLVPLRQEVNAGPATARNRGWRAASAPVVCFTDDDCIPRPGWREAHLARVTCGADIVQGQTLPVPEQRDRWNPLCRSYTRTRDGGFYETCNMAYRREVLEAVDGFDETFRFPYGEDTDLAWRAIDKGYAVQFCREAEVHHEVWTFEWPAYFADLRRREGMVQLVQKHPNLRGLFPAPWYEHRRHTAALQTTACLLAVAARPKSPVRWAAAGGAIANYWSVSKIARPGPRRVRHWAGYLPLTLASDLAEVGVMAVYSAKHRTFLL